MGLRSDSTVNKNKKVEKLFSDCSDDTGVFKNIENMQRSDTKGATGTDLVISLNVFISWMRIKSKTALYGKKRYDGSHTSHGNNIGTVFVMLERRKYF